MEAFIGSWKLEKSENFEDVMKALGICAIKRAAGNTAKPTHIFEKDPDGCYIFKTQSTFKNTECRFKLDEEFEEETSDGRKVKSVITLDGNVLKQTQTGGGKTTFIDRTVSGDVLDTVSITCLLFLLVFTI